MDAGSPIGFQEKSFDTDFTDFTDLNAVLRGDGVHVVPAYRRARGDRVRPIHHLCDNDWPGNRSGTTGIPHCVKSAHENKILNVSNTKGGEERHEGT